MKRRLVIAVTCVPMPPFFLALPLRQICDPLMGPLPVNSQIRAIKLVVPKRTGERSKFLLRCKQYFEDFSRKIDAIPRFFRLFSLRFPERELPFSRLSQAK